MKSSLFGIYNKYDKEEYQKDLQNTIDLAKRYPYSIYLLSELAYFKAVYNGGQDIKKVFEKFTKVADLFIAFVCITTSGSYKLETSQ